MTPAAARAPANPRISRARALGLIAALGCAPAACAKQSNAKLRVGSKNFTEELTLAQMYALLLEKAGYRVERRLNLGSTQIAMTALLRDEIDLYPEYTGTALLVWLKLPPIGDRRQAYETVKRAYLSRHDLVWLDPAPMNDTQALAMTARTADQYGVRSLSECARAAPRLRLGAVPEFTERADGLPGLRRTYGGFDFKSVRYIDIGLKYKALLDGDVDVAVAFATDGQIDQYRLVVLRDDRHFWPPYQVAPVVRRSALAQFPKLGPALNRLAPLLSDEAMRHLNWRVDGNNEEPQDVAADFLTKARLLSST
ncbi:MAG: quaternary ammonium transporter [Candidatus Eremiobacteraeota bacterium]|nr:quaternary ammonium transporter [Candidatus Eremiobacteraeota bacterium]